MGHQIDSRLDSIKSIIDCQLRGIHVNWILSDMSNYIDFLSFVLLPGPMHYVPRFYQERLNLFNSRQDRCGL